MSERVAIQLDTLTRLADSFRESRGISKNLTTEEMIELAATPVSEDTNKFSQVVDKTITEITAEDLAGITKIGEYVFNNCDSLMSVTIPDSVAYIGNEAFRNCNRLVEVINKSSLNIQKG